MTFAEAAQADMNWFAVLAHHASRTPDKAVAVFNDETISYREMAARAVGLAGGLCERGVGRGDVVALLTYNCPEFLETVFATNYLGAIAMPINWRLAAPEVRYILDHARARALVCDESLIDLANEATDGHRGSARTRVRLSCLQPWLDAARRTGDDGRATGAHARGGRRCPSLDVHVGDHRAPQGRHDHPRQSRLEEPGPHHRVRLHRR